ncbi:MAG: hypothetical protein R3B49_06430 [Phycisphaerales bacterium]
MAGLPTFEGVERGRVLLAMSGGVDSSVAAALLVEAGFEVVGCFMRLGSVGESVDEACETGSVRISHRGCCSVGDAADARTVAAQLGIDFHVANFRDDFGRIIEYFADEYARGRTPNPCVRCNDWLKFGRLHDQARHLGARYVASGHYARVDRAGAHPVLRRGLDDAKDQSYVLFGVGRDRLAEMLLPIGDMHKHEVRARGASRAARLRQARLAGDLLRAGRRLRGAGRAAPPGAGVERARAGGDRRRLGRARGRPRRAPPIHHRAAPRRRRRGWGTRSTSSAPTRARTP